MVVEVEEVEEVEAVKAMDGVVVVKEMGEVK